MAKITFTDKDKTGVYPTNVFRDADANEIKASNNALYDYEALGVFAALTASADTTITTGGTYYPILGTFSNDPISGFELVVDPAIQYKGTNTHYFEIDYHASVKATGNNRSISLGIKKNGVLVDASVMKGYAKTLAENIIISGTSVVQLETDDKIQLVCTCDASETLTFDSYTTTIRPFLYE